MSRAMLPCPDLLLPLGAIALAASAGLLVCRSSRSGLCKATSAHPFCTEIGSRTAATRLRCGCETVVKLRRRCSQGAVNCDGKTTYPDEKTTGVQRNAAGLQPECRQAEAKIRKRGEIQGIRSLTSVARIGKSPARRGT